MYNAPLTVLQGDIMYRYALHVNLTNDSDKVIFHSFQYLFPDFIGSFFESIPFDFVNIDFLPVF